MDLTVDSPAAPVDTVDPPRIRDAMERAARHPVLEKLESLESLRIFCRFHVFAVWDFMLLLQATRRSLFAGEHTWLPPSDPVAARSLSEIALEEESGVEVAGRPASHFELYLAAMEEFGAPTTEILDFTNELAAGASIEAALEAHAPPGAREFCLKTLDFSRRRFPERLAALTFARENLTSPMFRAILCGNPGGDAVRTAALRLYLERHIDVDGDEHSSITRSLVERFGEDPGVYRTAYEAIDARIRFWDAIEAALPD